MSCVSLPNDVVEPDDDLLLDETTWPVLIQGIRVYARQQPPKVQSDLLRWAELTEAMAKIQKADETA